MNVCHLYNKTTNSQNINKILKSFDSNTSLNIDNIEKARKYNVYIIETDEVDKELSLRLKRFFDSKSNVLIYFLVPKEYTLILFQLAFLLGAKSIITPNQKVNKTVEKIKNDYKLYENEYFKHALGKTFIQTQSVVLFKQGRPIFASDMFLKEFKCDSLSKVEEKILSQIDTNAFLSKDEKVIIPITNTLNKQNKYFLKSMNTKDEQESIILIEPYVQKKEASSVSTRVAFIELLKDKLIEKSISKKSFSIITINIENMKKLNIDLNKIEIEELLKDFLHHSEKLLDEKLILAQYSRDIYVALFEDIEFEKIKDKAQNFHTQLLNYIHTQKHHPAVGVFAFDITKSDLNDTLVMLENIVTKSLSQEEIKNSNIYYINNIQEHMSEKEMINFLLEDTFINSREFKLLNIFKGLCVNTASKIIKKTKDNITITFEQLQGIVIKDEKQTVIQSASFVKDIKATVKYINLEKKIAILEDFKFLNSSANSRKYSRVTCQTRTPIVLTYHGGTINGEVLDISVNSVAIKVKLIKNIEILKSKKVKITFTLPTRTSVDGFTKLHLGAEVTFIANIDKETSKIVCELSDIEDDSYESILMEYVYNRQKEIIIEVKKMVKSA